MKAMAGGSENSLGGNAVLSRARFPPEKPACHIEKSRTALHSEAARRRSDADGIRFSNRKGKTPDETDS